MCKQKEKKITHINRTKNQFGQETPVFVPAALGRVLGVIIRTETLCPGVFYVAARKKIKPFGLCSEYYIAEKNSPALSITAKAYGKEIPGHPELLSYLLEDEHSGRFIVEYEAYRFMLNHHIPLPEGETLRETAIYGAELNPEYFGSYPVPLVTPWGYTLRNKAITNGIYWLETEEHGWVLAIHCPLASELSEGTRKLGKYTDYDQEHDDQRLGSLFFDLKSSCLALFELIEFHGEWEAIVNKAALQNAVCLYYPNYAERYNISYAESVGTEFFQFE